MSDVGVVRRRSLICVIAVLLAATLAAHFVTPVHAVGRPVVIDNFNGTVLGTRTITPGPAPETSTTSPATFTLTPGLLTTTMNGNGNSAASLTLDYAMHDEDITDGGNNTQFFLEFQSIERTPVPQGQEGQTAALIGITVTDSSGNSGSYQTGISNTGPFNVVLNFSCSSGGTCFSGAPNFASINDISISITYPQNDDATESLTAEVSLIMTSPTGGAIPPPASPSVTTPTNSILALAGTASATFTVAFTSNGAPAPVGPAPSGSGNLTAADFDVTNTAGGTVNVTGGPSTYTVTVGPLTTSGTITVHVNADVAVDEWGQDNFASADDPTVTYTQAIVPVFTNANSTTFTAGSANSFSFATTGVPTPTFTETGTLPAGVSLTSGGVLSGTPGAGTGGIYPLQITAQNSVGSGTQSFTLTVHQAPTITSGNATSFPVNQSGTFTVTTQGFPAAALSESGALPAGVSFVDNGNGTATLAGTPTVPGIYPLTLTASNGGSPNATQGFTLTVSSAPAITSGNSATFTVGVAGSFSVTTSGVPAPALHESGALPPGVTFTDNGNGTASISGTPSVGSGGVYVLTLTATNGVTPSATQNFTLTVDGPPAITSATSTTFTAGAAGTFTVTTAAFPRPGLSESGALPPGVTFVDNGNGTATLAGTPGAGSGGVYVLTITADNGIAPPAIQTFTLTVAQAPAITSGAATTFTVGSAGMFLVTTTGTPAPALTESGALPAGVTFVDNGNGSATLAGTPAVGTAGTYMLTITASNGVVPPATQTFTLTVDEAPAITSASATTFTAGSVGTFTVTTTGTPAPALLETGPLPSGVTFVSNGDGTATLAGTPAAGTGGVYALTITASNGIAPDATQSFTLTIQEAPSITSASATTFTVGTAGTFTVTTTGAPAPALTETGSLPSGVTFVDNSDGTATLAGTPAAGTGGTYALTITASNGVVPQATQTFTLTVDEAPAITSGASTTFSAGIAGTFTVTTSGVPTPGLTESGALPSGVTFVDNGDGTATLAGTPAAGTGGVYTLTITASNGIAPDATQSFTLTVDEAPAITSSASTTFTTGTAGTFTVTTTGTPAPAFTESGALPSGVTFVDNGDGTATLAGTPAAGTGGTYALTITASNGIAPDATQSFTITVDEAPAITSGGSTTFTVGTAGTFTVTATGVPTPALMETGVLPSGVTFVDNGNGSATLAGTPAAGSGGAYSLTITASNGISTDATQSFTLTVDQAPAITSAAQATFEVGVTSSFTVTATGFPTPALTATGTVGGLTFVDNGDGTATLSGNPTSSGSFTLTVTAQNGIGTPATQTLAVTVLPRLTVTSTSLPAGTLGVPYLATLTASGGTGTYSWSVSGGSLPPGLTLTVSGIISGTPSTAGTFTFTIQVNDPATLTETIVIAPAAAANTGASGTTSATSLADTGDGLSIGFLSGFGLLLLGGLLALFGGRRRSRRTRAN